MKLRIYIVDDELMAIQYFNYLLEQTHLECEVVGQSTNSERALAEIIGMKPDVVFADINMPVMDGLELAEEILKRLSTKVILLTSYRDFDYVKRGIQIGVADYVLKNELDEASLKKLLEKTAQELIVEKKKQHLILEHNVRHFLLSDAAEMEDHVYEHKPMQRYGLVTVLCPAKICIKSQRIVERQTADCYELHRLPYPEGLSCSAFTEMTNGELCGIFFIDSSVTDGQEALRLACEEIMKYLQAQNLSGCCLISDTCYHFFDLQGSYQEMTCLTEHLYAYPKQTIFTAGQIRKDRAQKMVSDNWVLALSASMENADSAETEQLFCELLEQWYQNLNIWEYTDNMQNVYRQFRTFIQKHHLNEAILDIPDWYADRIAAEEVLLNCLRQILDGQKQEESSRYSMYVQQALAYIRKNYNRDISVPEIAEAVKISEGHLRRLFKQELNMKVLDYLTEYRLECAKLLMKNKEDNLSEIWKKTGFTSAQYFSYVFKKKEGVLPKDYYKQVRNG